MSEAEFRFSDCLACKKTDHKTGKCKSHRPKWACCGRPIQTYGYTSYTFVKCDLCKKLERKLNPKTKATGQLKERWLVRL